MMSAEQLLLFFISSTNFKLKNEKLLYSQFDFYRGIFILLINVRHLQSSIMLSTMFLLFVYLLGMEMNILGSRKYVPSQFIV